MDWYKCQASGETIDLLVTYSSTSFDCETKSTYANSKQKEYKGKNVFAKKKSAYASPNGLKEFITIGSLDVHRSGNGKGYCLKNNKSMPAIKFVEKALSVKCKDLTGHIKRLRENNVRRYKCRRGDRKSYKIYITSANTGNECLEKNQAAMGKKSNK